MLRSVAGGNAARECASGTDAVRDFAPRLGRSGSPAGRAPRRRAAPAVDAPVHRSLWRQPATVAGVNRRPRLTLLGTGATPEEAAAVVAAIEQFLRDTAPPVAPAEPAPDPWLRAARLEAVGHGPDEPTGWFGP